MRQHSNHLWTQSRQISIATHQPEDLPYRSSHCSEVPPPQPLASLITYVLHIHVQNQVRLKHLLSLNLAAVAFKNQVARTLVCFALRGYVFWLFNWSCCLGITHLPISIWYSSRTISSGTKKRSGSSVTTVIITPTSLWNNAWEFIFFL